MAHVSGTQIKRERLQRLESQEYGKMLKRIVVAHNESPEAGRALASAVQLARMPEMSFEQICDNSEDAWSWELGDPAETPEDRYERCEREELLWSAIRRLPYIFRQAVELQHAEDYSTVQVTRQLGISLPAAKGRLMYARRAVRRLSHARRSEPLRFSSGKTVHNHTSATMDDKVSCITGQVR
jgi:hypothetical protein